MTENCLVNKGDLWRCGKHRILCADSTQIENVQRLMDGQKADMVFTDPPYNINFPVATKRGCFENRLGKLSKKLAFIVDFKPENFLNILPTIFEKGKMNAYIFCNKDLLLDYLQWAKDNKFSQNVLVWKKNNPIPIGGSHRPDIEYLLFFRKSAIWNNGLENVNYSRCLEYDSIRGGSLSRLHPTIKPVELICNELQISSNENSYVVDFFLGSGSTILACEQTNRVCYGMELDPVYVEMCLARYKKESGIEPVREDGVTIDDLFEEQKATIPQKQLFAHTQYY